MAHFSRTWMFTTETDRWNSVFFLFHTQKHTSYNSDFDSIFCCCFIFDFVKNGLNPVMKEQLLSYLNEFQESNKIKETAAKLKWRQHTSRKKINTGDTIKKPKIDINVKQLTSYPSLIFILFSLLFTIFISHLCSILFFSFSLA